MSTSMELPDIFMKFSKKYGQSLGDAKVCLELFIDCFSKFVCRKRQTSSWLYSVSN